MAGVRKVRAYVDFNEIWIIKKCVMIVSRTEIVIDMLSVERNYLLVKSHLIGGPNERNIPPRTLAQVWYHLLHQLTSE